MTDDKARNMERLHIEALIELNKWHDAGVQAEELAAASYLRGFRAAMVATGLWSEGELLMHGDQFYISQGVERPMCGGMFLDRHPLMYEEPKITSVE